MNAFGIFTQSHKRILCFIRRDKMFVGELADGMAQRLIDS